VLRALSILAFVGMGVGAVLTLVAEDVILLLLGPRWEESGRIFAFFAPGIGAMLLYLAYSWIHLSIGRADRLFRWGLIELTVMALFCLLGLTWGPAGIAAACAVGWWILAMPALWYAGRPAGLGIASIVAAVWRYPLAAALAGATAAAVFHAIPWLALISGWRGALIRTVAASFLFGILYLGAVVLVYRGCRPLQQLVALCQDMFPRSLSSWPARRAARGSAAASSDADMLVTTEGS
jgi:PST family polysaccharide transporter